MNDLIIDLPNLNFIGLCWAALGGRNDPSSSLIMKGDILLLSSNSDLPKLKSIINYDVPGRSFFYTYSVTLSSIISSWFRNRHSSS